MANMRTSRQKAAAGILWQGMLLLLPLLLLACLGIVFLRRDRALIMQEARDRCQGVLGSFARSLPVAFDDGIQPEPGIDFSLKHATARQSIAVAFLGPENQLVYPKPCPTAPSPHTLALEELTEEQRALWLQAAKNAGDASREPVGTWDRFLELNPPEAFAAIARFSRATELASQEPTKAIPAFDEFVAHHSTALGESGVPLKPLAEWQSLLLRSNSSSSGAFDPANLGNRPWGKDVHAGFGVPALAGQPFDKTEHTANSNVPPAKAGTPNAERDERSPATNLEAHSTGFESMAGSQEKRLDDFCRGIVEFPGFLTPYLLEKAQAQFGASAATDRIGQWLRVWENHELARGLHRQSASLLKTLDKNSPACLVLSTPTESDWLLTWSPSNRVAIWKPLTNVVQDALAVWRREPNIPDYCLLSVEYGTQTLFSAGSVSWKQRNGKPGDKTGTGEADGLPADAQAASMPLLAVARLPEASGGQIQVKLLLRDSELLYGQLKTRAGWLGGLFLAALAASAIGLWTMWRSFKRQWLLNEMKTNFVSSVTHELRAPIASVRLMAENLKRGKIAGSERQQDYFNSIVLECGRLSSLIENMLRFARIEQGRQQYRFEPVDLRALAGRTVELLEPSSADRQVKLVLNGTMENGGDPVAPCDGTALQQALINLIDNALKHSPSGGEVVVGVDASALDVRLWVQDHGPGIPREEHERIFEQFYRRGSELRRESSGVGIGLTLVRHTMEAHLGEVLVESEPGAGSKFTLVLKRDLCREY
jgi:signal transduction histidine kinase